jgi:maltoporin
MTSIEHDSDPFCSRAAPRSSGRSFGKRWLALLTLLGALAPRSALAEGSDPSPLPATNFVDMFMYGRMGLAWTLSGQLIAGKSMNLGDKRAIGGRLEEGDYLEPGLRVHLLKGEQEGDTKVDVVADVEIYSDDGAIVSDLANGDVGLLHIVPEQAYLQAQNLFVKDLTLWAGARLYRKNDIHIADYFYFDNLPSQGIGVMYKGLDTAVLINTGSSPFFRTDLNAGMPAPAAPEIVQRQRTMFVVQYKQPIAEKHYVKGLGEFHLVPKSGSGTRDAPENVNPGDYGWVLGAKLHLDLGRDQFNDFSVRYGRSIANGAASGRSTYDTFGAPAADGTYSGAYGVEIVEHFMWNIGTVVSLNGYATFHYDQGARDVKTRPPAGATPDNRTDFTVGVRPVGYLHKNFHLMGEATYQVRKDQGLKPGTALKLSLVPTIVPTGEPGFWARPHIRVIYTFGLYNQAAVDQLMSPYLQTVGPSKTAHFLGTRAEWWFY